jgi:hypothetical protein
MSQAVDQLANLPADRSPVPISRIETDCAQHFPNEHPQLDAREEP